MFVFELNFYNFLKKEKINVDLIVDYNIITIGIDIFQFHVSINGFPIQFLNIISKNLNESFKPRGFQWCKKDSFLDFKH
jgi:hypothetical protein